MISVQTKLKIKDNSGGKLGQCIKIYKKKTAEIGDIILVTIKEIRQNTNKKIKIKKSNIVKALVIQTKYKKKNKILNYINFDENSVILLNNQNQPIATRILTPITTELRKKKFFKIISLSSNIL